MLEAAHGGAIDVLYNVGGNLLATMPDTGWVHDALGRIRLRIHQDINVNSSTLIEPGEAVLLLPAQTRYEQRDGGTSTSTERRIRFSPEIPGHPQVGECRAEWEIPGQIAAAARPELQAAFAWSSGKALREEMGRVMPVYSGIEHLNAEGDSLQWGGPMLCIDGDFSGMPGNRALFSPLVPPQLAVPPGHVVLTTRRGKQFNSMVFDRRDTLQGGRGRDDVFLSEEDAASLGVREGDPIILRNELGRFQGVARIGDLAPGGVQAYWPELNPLIPRGWDPISEEPDYNAFVRLERG